MDKIFTFFDRSFGHYTIEDIDKDNRIYGRFMEESERFVENLPVDEFDDEEKERNNKFKNRNNSKQYFYYLMSYLYRKILETGFSLSDLMEPKNLKQYITTRIYFNNLIEIMEMVNPDEKEYNHHAYKWIINNEDFEENLRIIENFNEPRYRIINLNGKYFREYLLDNKIGITISGTLFKIHEEKLSLFYKFLNDLYTLRKQYKNEMYKYEKGSFERAEFNRRQLTTKVIMNSTYGLLGMSSFRYSNKWLAKSITVSGRVALKTAQYYAEKYLDTIKISDKN